MGKPESKVERDSKKEVGSDSERKEGQEKRGEEGKKEEEGRRQTKKKKGKREKGKEKEETKEGRKRSISATFLGIYNYSKIERRGWEGWREQERSGPHALALEPEAGRPEGVGSQRRGPGRPGGCWAGRGAGSVASWAAASPAPSLCRRGSLLGSGPGSRRLGGAVTRGAREGAGVAGLD